MSPHQAPRPEQGPHTGSNAEVDGAIAAVDRMMDVVDGFEAYVVHAADRDRHGTRYRLNLLWIHCLAALLIAPLLSLTGRDGLSGPSFSFLRTIPGAPYSLSTLLGAGGFVLGMGCIWRHKRVEQAGLALLMVFYVLLAVSFAVPPIAYALGDAAVKPPMYAPVVYAHLAVIMAVHIWALRVRVRDERAATDALIGATDDDEHLLGAD